MRPILGALTATDKALFGVPPTLSDESPIVGPSESLARANPADQSLKKNLPLQVKILLNVLNRKANGKHLHYITEVLILQDPTVDGTKPTHKKCLREAIMDTYPRAHDDHNYTIQDLINDAIEKDLYYGPKAPAATGLLPWIQHEQGAR